MDRNSAHSKRDMRDLAQQLLSYQAAISGNSETNHSNAFSVLDEMRRPLSRLVGVEGYRVLLNRALALARAEMPSLSAVTAEPDALLAGLSKIKADQLSEAGLVLAAQLFSLLVTFIGEALTLRIVQSTWPGFRYIRQSGESEHDSGR